MRFIPAFLITVGVALFSPGAAAQSVATEPQDTPDFTVQVWGVATADFDARMLSYAELRSQLQQGLPPLQVTDDPRDILEAEHALATRIRAMRAGADGGEIFTPEIAGAFRHALELETRASTCASILDDNPGSFSYAAAFVLKACVSH